MSTFDDSGLTPDRFDAVLDALETALKAAFGDNVKLSPDSVIGQFCQILAYAIAEQNELIESVAAAFDPQGATGAALSKLVLLNGITQNELKYSTVQLECAASASGCTILAGSLVSDPATGVQVATDSELVVAPSATDTVAATAVVAGPTDISAETLTRIDTPIYGWASVTNPLSSTIGETEETDAELRLRRQLVSERAGSCNVPAIYGAISELSGVISAFVFENTKDAVDANGVPGHSVWAIVYGGDPDDIAGAIFDHLGAGIGTYGTSTVEYDPDFATGQTFDIDYSAAEEVPIFIVVSVTADDDYPADGDTQMVAALEAWGAENLKLGDDVVVSRLYTPINSIPGHSIDSVLVGFDDDPSETSKLVVPMQDMPVVDAANIVIIGGSGEL